MELSSKLKDISRLLSKVLRHKPESLGLKLDKEGYTDVNILLTKLNININELEKIVDTNDKKRFAFNHNKTKIRANQGHSIDVDIKYKKVLPNVGILYHGTSLDIKDLILKDGLIKGNRNYVHLTKDINTAKITALRKSKNTIVFEINASQMIMDGLNIFISDNNVYLTEWVNPKYINHWHIFINK